MGRVITLRCNDVLHAKFKGTCASRGDSMNKVLIQLIQQYIKTEGEAPDVIKFPVIKPCKGVDSS